MKRTYNIPLRKAYINKARYKKTPAAIKAIRIFLMKHMKADEVKLGKKLNNSIWVNGIKNPPCKVSVEAEKKDNVVYAELVGVEYYEPTKADLEAAAEAKKNKKKLVKAAKKEEDKVVEKEPNTKETEVVKEETKKTDSKKEA